MPLQEHKEPWFMRLNLGEEVPVFLHGDTIISDYNQIIDYLEKNFVGGWEQRCLKAWQMMWFTACAAADPPEDHCMRPRSGMQVLGLITQLSGAVPGAAPPFCKLLRLPKHRQAGSQLTGSFVSDAAPESGRLSPCTQIKAPPALLTYAVAQLVPDADSPLHDRVQQYRQLLDGLPMDAYTHGCILHPELTTDSMIPKYATAEIRKLMKLDHEEPQLTEPYLSKQKKLMAKILDHDNVNYLKKILGELAMVLDQVEAELEKRKLEYQGQKCELWLCGPEFTLADVCLGALLHRLKFLGLSKKYWEDGSRPNLQSFFLRVQKRYAFRRVLGDIHTTLLSAVLPNAFRMVKKKPPSFFGASFLMGSLGGMGYFAYWYLKKKYM
ncbi:hypothetical protein FQN60_002403 [Etheostoma spectabile]|uniref:GST N-terminal domain-containing protein n=1 Tax=Etheostoma spectabile TaxID=54343 RepID=A0A5J5DDF7_9PERO|nr:hypothetical protein FQN60_002403 [Etheostoma spectabile]